MLALINNILDRCFFTVTFIFGVQLPAFMQQYQQRLAGHLNEAQLQLEQFNIIAQQHFDGSLVTMISRYKNNNEASISSTGELIEALVARVQYLGSHLEQINSSEYLTSLYLFLRHLDGQIAKATANDFSMAIPIELNALATGAVLAVGVLLIKTLLAISIKSTFKTRQQETI